MHLKITKEITMPFIVGLFTKGLTFFLTKLLTSLASAQMIEWAFFKVAEAVVQSTATTKDDEWYEKVKEVYKTVR